MPDRPRLAAASRTVTGKAVAHLRKEGRVPAVVYGHGTASESVSLDAHEFDQLRRRTGASTLIDLSVDGDKVRPVLVYGIQVHPVHRRPLHVDLLVVRMTEELTVEVPLVGMGFAPATSPAARSSTRCRRQGSRAARQPARVAHVRPVAAHRLRPDGDGRRPRGARGRHGRQAEPTEVVARVLAPRVEEEVPVAAAAAEAEEGAEGAEAEPAESSAPADEG